MGDATAIAAPAVHAGVARGRALFNRGDFWGSHEALEPAWQRSAMPDRAVIQALIQAGAAFHKYVVQDNAAGARILLGRALDALDGVPDGTVGLALPAFRAELAVWDRRLATAAAATGWGSVVGLPRLEWSGPAGTVLAVEATSLFEVESARLPLGDAAPDAERALLVAVSAGGVTGWGECPLDWDAFGAWEALTSAVLPALLAEPVAAPSEVGVVLAGLARDPALSAGVEAALWDLWSQRLGVPLVEALGGAPRRVAMAGRARPADASVLAADVERLQSAGYAQLILPARPNADRRLLPALTSGLAVAFGIDLGGSYRRADFDALRVLDGLGAVWLAQPVAETDLPQGMRLARWLETPVSLGGWSDEERLAEALHWSAPDVVHVDPVRFGATAATAVLATAASRGVPAWVSASAVTPVGAHLGLATACLADGHLACDVSRARDGAGAPAVVPGADGRAAPGTGAGLGVSPAAAVLAAASRSATLRA